MTAHDIYTDTPLHPLIIAECVVGEIGTRLRSCDPNRYIDALEQRAITCYANNAHFRKCVRRRGNAGRDTLYAFMRHWLAGHLKHDHPALFNRLPMGYSIGIEP